MSEELFYLLPISGSDQFVKVDPQVAEIVGKRIIRLKHGGYPYISLRRGKTGQFSPVAVHLLAINEPPFFKSPSGLVVDHINRDRLDARRCNLRFATYAENARNRDKWKGTTSKFRGVFYSKHRKKWEAGTCRTIDGRVVRISLGAFRCEEDAAKAFDHWLIETFGDAHGPLNFPVATNIPPTGGREGFGPLFDWREAENQGA